MTAGGRFTSPTGSNITTGQIRRVVKCCSTNVFIPLQRVYWFQYSEVISMTRRVDLVRFRPHKVYILLNDFSQKFATQWRRGLISITRRVDLAIDPIKYIYFWSACPFLRKLVSQLKSYQDETFPKVLFFLQVVYKWEPAGSDHYIL